MARLQRAFTLIELMVVIAIIGLLSTIALPTFQDYIIRGQVAEALAMSESLQRSVAEYYRERGRFPADNRSAGVPASGQLIGNYVSGIELRDGGIHITLGNRINALAKDKVLSLRPAFVPGSPATPVAWLCGYAEPVEGMQAQGANATDLPAAYLSPACRSWRN